MVSSFSTPGFPPVHAHPTRLPTLDARLSAALDSLVASMRADLRAIRDSDFALCKALDYAVAPLRRNLALLRHDLALGAGEGSDPTLMSSDDAEIPDLGHQKLPRLGIQDREGSPQRIPSNIQVHSIPSLLSSSPLLRAMANSPVQPSHSNDFVSATVPKRNVEKTKPVVMVTTTPLLFPISATFSTESTHAHSHNPVLSTTEATTVAHIRGFPLKNVGATKYVGLSHTNTTKRRHEVWRSLIYNLSHGKVKWHWILNSLLACYTDGKVGMNDVYLNKIHGWVGLYEVGKFVMVFNAEKVLDEIAKRQSQDAAGNLFDRMTPLFHNMVVCSQFCITRGELWNGWDPGGRLAKILGVLLCSKHQENRCVMYGCVLRCLKLSDKAMGERGVNAFGSLLRSQNILEELYLMNVAGLNMYHNMREWHHDVIKKIKGLNEKGNSVTLMIDTEGQANYEGFSGCIKKGDELVIDGVMACFEVLEKLGSGMRCKCTYPGLFMLRAKIRFWRDRKLVERNYKLPTLSTKDLSNIEFRLSQGINFIVMSFVNEAESEKHLKNHLFTNKRIIALMLYKDGRIGYAREHCKMLLGKWGVVDVNDCCSCAIYLVDSGMINGKHLCITTNSQVVGLSVVSSRRPVILANKTYATKTDALEAVMHAPVHFQGSLTFVCNRYQLLILAIIYTADEDLESITVTETELQSMEFLDRFVKWCKNIKSTEILEEGARKANVGIAYLNFHDSGIIVLLKFNLGLPFLNLHWMLSTAELGYHKVENENQKLYNMVQNLREDLYTAQLKIKSCTGDNGLSILDATVHSVKFTTDAFKLMKFGEGNRMVSSSAFRNCSSRSYSVLMVHVKGKDTLGGTLRNCLHLVDLAGSVQVENSGVTGDRRKEAQYIQKSLPCLLTQLWLKRILTPFTETGNSHLCCKTQLLLVSNKFFNPSTLRTRLFFKGGVMI